MTEYIRDCGENTFSNCTSLKEITLNNNLTRIGLKAFMYCKSLININLSQSLKSIGFNLFGGCTSLKSITLYDILLGFSNSVFDNCPNFDTLTIIGNKNMTTIIPLYVFQKIKYLYVDNNLISEYETFKTNNNLTFNIKHLLV